MQHYTVRRISQERLIEDRMVFLPWEMAVEGQIALAPWADFLSYQPQTRFYCLYSSAALWLLMLTRGEDEHKPRTSVTEDQGPVCQDSCLEFFLAPEGAKPLYANFELNAAAVLHLGLGEGRHQRRSLSADALALVRREAVRPCDELAQRLQFTYDWGVSLGIPLSLMQQWSGEIQADFFSSGRAFGANLYKCGDKSLHKHYMTWAPVTTDKPDFHRPEFFGRFILE